MMTSRVMSRAYFAAIPLLLVLSACGGPKGEPAPVEPKPVDAVHDASTKIPLRGIVTTSGEVATFSLCGAPAGAAVTLTGPAGELADAFASLNAKPTDGIYVEIQGGPSADGTSYVWTKIVRARGVGEGIACDAPVFEGEFVANGNEPFWAIEIRDKGIVYRSPEIPQGRVYPYALTPTASDAVLYASKTNDPVVSTIEIALEPARCIDSMSGELRSFKAHLVLDGQRLEGCAREGVPHGEFGDAPLDELRRFAGAYPRTVHLWDEPVIHERLLALLGTAMPLFLEAMKVQSPLIKDNEIYYVTGNKPHRGGLDNAAFLADPASDTLAVILYVNGTRRDFKEGGRDVAIPKEVVAMIDTLETH